MTEQRSADPGRDEVDVNLLAPVVGVSAAIVQSMLVGALVGGEAPSAAPGTTGALWTIAAVLGVVAIASLVGGLFAARGADQAAARRGRRGASTLVYLVGVGILVGVFAVLFAVAAGHSAFTDQPLAEVQGAAAAMGVLLAYALPMLVGAVRAARARKKYGHGDVQAAAEARRTRQDLRSGPDTLGHRAVGLALLVVGLAAMCGAGWLVGAALLDDNAELRAYQAAPLCPERPDGPSDCRWREKANVLAVDPHEWRHDDPSSVVLEYGKGWTEPAAFADDGPVFAMLDVGDEVTMTVWDGRITAVTVGDLSQETLTAPYDHVTRYGIGALVVTPSAVLLAVAGGWRLVRPGAERVTSALITWATMLVVAGISATLIADVLGPGELGAEGAGAEHESFFRTLLVWIPIALLCGAWAFWRSDRDDEAWAVRR